MRRREFVAGLVLALPIGARAQQTIPTIGYLGPESPTRFASRVKAFQDGLAEAGYVESRNIKIEYRWAEGQYDRLPFLAEDLVQQQVAVIAAPGGAPVGLAAKSATTTIPIVFEMGGDPIKLGVIDNLYRPAGNITGISSLSVEVGPKRLELLHELVPTATTMAVVVNPTSPTAKSQLSNLQETANALGLKLQILQGSTEEDFVLIFASLAQLSLTGVGGLVFTSDPFFANRSEQLAALAVRHGVPAVHQSRDFPIAGGLVSFGGSFVTSHRQAGVYTGRILKGEKPGDLPVQQVTKVELLINARTAQTLGIKVPPALLARADEVIE